MEYGTTQYGLVRYAENTPDSGEIKLISPDLMKYMPDYYKTSSVTKQIENSNSLELGKLNYRIKDVSDQMNVNTATWGLTRWENEYRIETNMSLSYEERREVIDAARAGQGTATKKMIKMVAEKFSGGEVNIIENTASFYFTIQFVGVKGIPKNMQAFKNMLEDIKPAHMGYEFLYTYTIWNLFSERNLTWNDTKVKTWNELKVYS